MLLRTSTCSPSETCFTHLSCIWTPVNKATQFGSQEWLNRAGLLGRRRGEWCNNDRSLPLTHTMYTPPPILFISASKMLKELLISCRERLTGATSFCSCLICQPCMQSQKPLVHQTEPLFPHPVVVWPP